jgi:hypothetical protein
MTSVPPTAGPSTVVLSGGFSPGFLMALRYDIPHACLPSFLPTPGIPTSAMKQLHASLPHVTRPGVV